MPGITAPTSLAAPAAQGTAAYPGASACDDAFELRDQALAALDAADPLSALALAKRGLAVLTTAGLGGGLDEAALLLALAEIEEALDRFGPAATTIGRAITLLGGAAGPALVDGELEAELDRPRLWCQAHQRQAGLERLAGDFGAATARLAEVLDVAEAVFGEACAELVSAANALGVVYKHAGDLDAAAAAYQRAMAAAELIDVRDPLTEAALLHNLAGLAHSRGDAEGGIPLAERGLALRLGALPDAHPEVAADLNALGALYHLAGRYGDAADSCQRALVVFENCYGPDHFEVAMACANLAAIRADQGDFAAAESLNRRALRILQAVFGPKDAEVGLTILNLAGALAGQGQRVQAAALAADASAILSDRLPANHPYVVAAGEALNRWGEPPWQA